MRGEALIWLIGLLLLLGVGLREVLLFLVGLVLLLMVVITRLWARYCLRGLSYHRVLGSGRAFFGEDVSLTLEIGNAKPLPLAWLEVEEHVPGAALGLSPGRLGPSHRPGRRVLSMMLSMRSYERIKRHYTIHAGARGLHPFGPATLRTGDIFGVMNRELEVPGEQYLLVYPRIVPLAQLALPTANPFGEIPPRRQWLFDDPLRTVGVRDYHPGDSPRRLHWKATARAPGQTLQVKVFEPTTTHRLLVLLNVTTAASYQSWQGYDPEALEAAITTAASVASWAVDRGLLVGLAANARLFHSTLAVRLPPSRDPAQLMHVLEALATLVPLPTMSAETLIELETPGLPFGTTVVLVTAVIDERLIQQLLGLKRAGHQPALLLVTDSDAPLAPLDGLPAYAIQIADTR